MATSAAAVVVDVHVGDDGPAGAAAGPAGRAAGHPDPSVPGRGPHSDDFEFEILARGVTCKAIYDRTALAFVPQSMHQRDVSGAIVVHPCSLLDVLLDVFDELWERATPLTAVRKPDAVAPGLTTGGCWRCWPAA